MTALALQRDGVRTSAAPALQPPHAPAAVARPPLLVPAATAQPGLFQAARCLLLRDLQAAWCRRADVAATLIFFAIVASLFPLGVGADAALLRTLAPGVVWVAALLASMLSLGRLFADDHRDGTLEQLLLSPAPLPLLVLAKMAAHWLTSGLPLALLSPLLAVQFDLPPQAAVVLLLSLLLGTPVLSLLGGIGAALTVGVRGAGVLLSLLVLPLLVPVLIFGAAAVGAAATAPAGQAALAVAAHFSLLGAMLVMALVLAPLATAAALRIAMD